MDEGFEMKDNGDGKSLIRIKKIPLEDLLTILEKLYEAGTNYVDMDFVIDPNEEQSVITISTKPEYQATQEELEEEERMLDEFDDDEDDDEDDDPILSWIRKQQVEEAKKNGMSDEDIDKLI